MGDLEFFKEVHASTSLTEGQKRYRDNLEQKIKSDGSNAEGSPTAKKPRVEVGEYKYEEEVVTAAHSKGVISAWEKDRYAEWRAFGSLSEKQKEIKENIETKLQKYVSGQWKPNSSDVVAPAGDRKDVGKKYTADEIARALADKRSTNGSAIVYWSGAKRIVS